MHFMGILREVRCVIKQGFGGRSPPRQKQNKIDYYNKNKQCADRRVDLYERNTKWPSRRQLSATCLSPLCSTWCLGLALELFELHIFDIRTWPKEASNKNEIFQRLAKSGRAITPMWGVPVLACTCALVCERELSPASKFLLYVRKYTLKNLLHHSCKLLCLCIKHVPLQGNWKPNRQSSTFLNIVKGLCRFMRTLWCESCSPVDSSLCLTIRICTRIELYLITTSFVRVFKLKLFG